MAQFPSSIFSVTTHNTGDVIQAVDVNNPENEINAIETKVGVDGSAVTTTVDYLLKNSASINPGHLHTLAAGINDASISSPAANQVLTYNGTKWTNQSNQQGFTIQAGATTTITAGQALKYMNAFNQDTTLILTVNSVNSGSQNIGVGQTYTKIGQQFTPNSTLTIGGARVFCASPGTNAGIVGLHVQADNGSNLPTGTDLIAGYTAVADVSVSGQLQTFALSGQYTLTSGQKYWFILDCTGITGTNKYITFNYTSPATYPNGNQYGWNGSAWVATTFDTDGGLVAGFPGAGIIVGLLNTNDGVNNGTDFIGFATTAASSGQAVTIQVDGEVAQFTNLATGKVYYGQDTNGSIGLVVGTHTKKLGVALSNTTLEIQLV